MVVHFFLVMNNQTKKLTAFNGKQIIAKLTSSPVNNSLHV